MSNKERVERAQDVVHAYSEGVGLADDDPETQLSDLISDLRHFAFSQKLEWDEVMRRANDHFTAETACTCRVCSAQFALEDSEHEDICDECSETAARQVPEGQP
jgi:hypothetical protein